MNNTEILNEVYFGEQPELSQALIYLRLFREAYYGLDGALSFSWGSDKNLDKFNMTIAELFGFKSFYLNVYSTVITDAHTITCKYCIGSSSLNSKIKKTRKGYKYNGLISAIVTISTALIFNEKFTDREIMGIILHEIGHCFSNKIVPLLDIEGKVVGALSLPYIVIQFLQEPFRATELLTGYSQIFREFYMGMKKNDILGIIFNSLEWTNNIFKDTLIAIINSIPGIRFIKLKSGRIYIDMPFTYLDENIADNFATIYGFGPDLVTGLSKLEMNMTRIKGTLYEIPVVGWLTAIADISAEFATQLFDGHPTVSSRRKAQYNYLKREMNKQGINPKLKKEISTEIDRMEECIHGIETSYGRFGGKLFYAKLNKLLDKLKNGDDIRAYIYPYKLIDRMYDVNEK